MSATALASVPKSFSTELVELPPAERSEPSPLGHSCIDPVEADVPPMLRSRAGLGRVGRTSRPDA